MATLAFFGSYPAGPMRGMEMERKRTRPRRASKEELEAACFLSDYVPPREPTEAELVEAVKSLCNDGLRPYGRLVRKRLGELAEAAGVKAPDADVGRLRILCGASAQLKLESEGEADWSAVIAGEETVFVDIYSDKDTYSDEFWAELADHFESQEDSEITLPGGRYVCAQGIAARKLPCLAGFNIGQICHVVQIAMTKRKLLGYKNGAIVPYARSQTAVKEQCADQQRLCKRNKLPLATWKSFENSLRQLLLTTQEEGLPLSNIKRLLRAGFHIDLSETALGHSTVSELVRDERLKKSCTVKLFDNGYYVFPSEELLDEAKSNGYRSGYGAYDYDRSVGAHHVTTSEICSWGRPAPMPPALPASLALLSTTPTRPTPGLGSVLSCDTPAATAPQQHQQGQDPCWGLMCNALGMAAQQQTAPVQAPVPAAPMLNHTGAPMWPAPPPAHCMMTMSTQPSAFSQQPMATFSFEPAGDATTHQQDSAFVGKSDADVPPTPLLEVTATPSPYVHSRVCFNQMIGAACFDFDETSPQSVGMTDLEASASTSSEAEDFFSYEGSESSFSEPPTPRLIVSAPPTPFIRTEGQVFSAASSSQKFAALLEAANSETTEREETESRLASTFGSCAFGLYDDADCSLPATPRMMVASTPTPSPRESPGAFVFADMLTNALRADDECQPAVSSTRSTRIEDKRCDEDAEDAKKRRTLEKKMRQILDIEQRLEQGQTLNPDQAAKLSRKAEIEADLQALGRSHTTSDATSSLEEPASALTEKVAQLAELAKGGKNAELEAELRRLLCQQ